MPQAYNVKLVLVLCVNEFSKLICIIIILFTYFYENDSNCTIRLVELVIQKEKKKPQQKAWNVVRICYVMLILIKKSADNCSHLVSQNKNNR